MRSIVPTEIVVSFLEDQIMIRLIDMIDLNGNTVLHGVTAVARDADLGQSETIVIAETEQKVLGC